MFKKNVITLLKKTTMKATTIAAIKEGRKIAYDKSVKGYTNMDDLRRALGVNK